MSPHCLKGVQDIRENFIVEAADWFDRVNVVSSQAFLGGYESQSPHISAYCLNVGVLMAVGGTW